MILGKRLTTNFLVSYNFVQLFAFCVGQDHGAHRIKGNRPNIIIIMADDMVSIEILSPQRILKILKDQN